MGRKASPIWQVTDRGQYGLAFVFLETIKGYSLAPRWRVSHLSGKGQLMLLIWIRSGCQVS